MLRPFVLFLGLVLFLSNIVVAEELILDDEKDKKKKAEKNYSSNKFFKSADSSLTNRRLIHSLTIEGRPEYLFPTNPFLKGDNEANKPIRKSFSTHLKYAFQSYPNSYADILYGGAYQGIGVSFFNFYKKEELGNPMAFYLFQGARIARFNPRLSLNYEWNFGVSLGWKPYDYDHNMYNIMIGSKVNAYINTNFYFSWMLTRHLDLISGVTLNHFSNGNTKFPNAGLNSIGLKLGVVYNMNRKEFPKKLLYRPYIPEFPKHISYDVVLFGSWRRKGVNFGDRQVPSPDSYTVLGFNFAPMYNFGYKLRAGISLDGVYDGSANVYTEDYIVGTEQEFYKPSLSKQLSLGLSARGEYVMPHFTVGIGLGVNVLHGGGDLKSFYQMLALKIEVTRNSFIHIGYNLKDFHTPNYLMLGIGFRLNNKYPVCYR